MYYLRVIIRIVLAVHLAKAKGINLARGKPVMEVQQRFWTRPTSFAVDGSLSGHFKSCTHTNYAAPEGPNWWLVNLQARYMVKTVAIRNRSDRANVGYRLKNFLVTVWEMDPAPLIKDNMYKIYCTCVHYPDSLPTYGLIDLHCTTNCTGQFVAIILPVDVLTLCEVEVYGDLLDYQSRISMGFQIVPGKRSSVRMMNTTYMAETKECCMVHCLQTHECLGVNYIDVTGRRTCQLLNANTNPLYNVITDVQSTWLVVNRITF